MEHLLQEITVFVLAIFVGYYVIWSVTPALHSPLMSIISVDFHGASLQQGREGRPIGSLNDKHFSGYGHSRDHPRSEAASWYRCLVRG